MFFLFRLLSVLGACLLLGASAFSADVTGTVRLANGAPAKNAVVWLEGAVRSKPLKGASIDQRDLTFIPHVSVVTVGTTIRFPNNDTVYHNVFAEFEAKRFDFGMYPKGTSKSKLFDKPGIVALLCSVHSNMSAFIMVVDTPYYAIADKQGRFHISGVQEGSYQAKVWHESNQSYQGAVNVSGAGAPLSLRTARR